MDDGSRYLVASAWLPGLAQQAAASINRNRESEREREGEGEGEGGRKRVSTTFPANAADTAQSLTQAYPKSAKHPQRKLLAHKIHRASLSQARQHTHDLCVLSGFRFWLTGRQRRVREESEDGQGQRQDHLARFNSKLWK